MIIARVRKFYRWLVYRSYRYSVKHDFKFSRHWVNAAIYVCAILIVNLLTVMLLLPRVIVPSGIPNWIVGAFVLAVAFGQVAFLVYGGRYNEIVREFSKETVVQQRRGDRLYELYVGGSFFAFIGLAIVVASI